MAADASTAVIRTATIYSNIPYIREYDLMIHIQCLKLMVAQSPLATKNRARPVKFDPGQVRITSTMYAVLPLFATRLAACTGGIWVTFIEPYLI